MLKSARTVTNESGEYIATLTPTAGSIVLSEGLNKIRWARVGKLVSLAGVLAVQSVASPDGSVEINMPSLPLYDTASAQISAEIIGGGQVAFFATSTGGTLKYLTGGGFADLADRIQGGTEIYINFNYIAG